jgi:hypothetical protein
MLAYAGPQGSGFYEQTRRRYEEIQTVAVQPTTTTLALEPKRRRRTGDYKSYVRPRLQASARPPPRWRPSLTYALGCPVLRAELVSDCKRHGRDRSKTRSIQEVASSNRCRSLTDQVVGLGSGESGDDFLPCVSGAVSERGRRAFQHRRRPDFRSPRRRHEKAGTRRSGAHQAGRSVNPE